MLIKEATQRERRIGAASAKNEEKSARCVTVRDPACGARWRTGELAIIALLSSAISIYISKIRYDTN